MANTLTVQSLNDKFTAAIEDASNFVKESKNWAGELLKKGTRSGAKATLYFDGMGGTEVTDDVTGTNAMSIASLSGDVKQYSVDLEVANAKGKVTWSQVEERFKLGSLDEDLVKPTGNNIAEKIVKQVIANSSFRSTGVVVAAKSNGISANFQSIASAIASLRKMRSGMTLVGHVDSDTIGTLASLPVVAGNNHFDAPSEKLADLYGDAAVGTFHRCAMIDEPLMTSITTGGATAGTVLVNGAISTAGATEIKIDGLTASTGTIKKGEAFTIAGVNRCTASGVELVNTPYAFVVQEDATIASNGATLKVLPIYFTGAGYIPTVGVSSIPDNAAVTWLTGTSAKTYAISIIRAREALNWTPIEMEKIRGCENGVTTTPTMSVHTAFDGNITNAENTGRLDVLFCGKIVDPRLVRTIYWEV